MRIRKAASPTASLPRLLVAFLLALLPALLVPAAAPATAAPAPLRGLFALAAGSCGSGAATGSYFRMILANGSPSGPFLSNSDSTCGDETYTLLSPGTDGGLRLGELQPQPTPVFDGSGNARSARLIDPVRFYGVDFSAATNPVDPQTGTKVTAPKVTASGSTVTADLRALGVSWNNQQFNQGAPKPDGSTPGNTRLATGRYDSSTGELTLQWTSQIQGGPFNGFTGLWHLTGTVTPAKAVSSPAAVRSSAPSGTTAPTGGTTSTTAPSASTSAAPPAAATATALPSDSSTAPAPAADGGASSSAPAAVPLDDVTRASGADEESGLGFPVVLAVALVVAVGAGGFVLQARRSR